MKLGTCRGRLGTPLARHSRAGTWYPQPENTTCGEPFKDTLLIKETTPKKGTASGIRRKRAAWPQSPRPSPLDLPRGVRGLYVLRDEPVGELEEESVTERVNSGIEQEAFEQEVEQDLVIKYHLFPKGGEVSSTSDRSFVTSVRKDIPECDLNHRNIRRTRWQPTAYKIKNKCFEIEQTVWHNTAYEITNKCV